MNNKYNKSELTDEENKFMEKLQDDLDLDWQSHLIRSKRSKTIISNSQNVELVLTNGELKDALAFDAFRLKSIVLKDLPWRQIPPYKNYDHWNSTDDARLQHYLNKKYNIKGEKLVKNACIEVMMKNIVHPIKDLITSTQWDGVKRVESVIIDFLGAEDSNYVRAISKIFFTAAVTRIFQPGHKYDYMLVLVGEQGIRKSSFVEAIALDWYSAGPPDFKSKEAAEILQNAWIIEIPELSAMRKNDIEQTKAFISKTLDEYRPAYTKYAEMFPRKCVFIGTTNTYDFLTDATGNRRFWPIDLEKNKIKYDFSKLDLNYIRQLWAEAYSYYLDGEKLALSEKLEAVARKEQEKHFSVDPTKGLIEEYLNMSLPNNWLDIIPDERFLYFKRYLSDIDAEQTEAEQVVRLKDKVSAIEIWVECLGKKGNLINNFESKKIGAILTSLGWKTGNQKRARFKYYGQQKVFFRV